MLQRMPGLLEVWTPVGFDRLLCVAACLWRQLVLALVLVLVPRGWGSGQPSGRLQEDSGRPSAKAERFVDLQEFLR